MRAALGCSRARLIMNSFVESAILAVAGAAGGLALAWWGLAALRSAFFNRLTFFSAAGLDDTHIDWRVLLFTLACALFSTLLFGVSPALSGAALPLNEALRTGGRGSTSADRHNVRSVLVVVQVSLSLLLLTGAGLLGKSFLHLMSVNPGFQTERIITADINLPGAQYRTTAQVAAFYDNLLDRAAALPGVRTSGLTDTLPLSGEDNRMGVQIEGREPRPGEMFRLHPRLVSMNYLGTMNVPLLQGRWFTATDAGAKRPVAIVSDAAARKYWPEGSPVGQRFRFTNENAPWLEVIGVAGGVHNMALDQESTQDVYLPYRENPFLYAPARMTLVLGSDLDETALASSIRTAVASLDRSVAVSDIRPIESRLTDSVAPKRFSLILLTLFAMMAIVLAAAGLYGILSYLVSQRMPEIGIRMALGASKRDVVRMVMGRGAMLAGAGIVLGVAASLAATRALSKLLFDVHPHDPAILGAISIFLAIVALLASYIPARRATKVDPLVALRTE